MVVADTKESIERLALHFRVIRNINNLEYEDITDNFKQYRKFSIEQVCNGPCGWASVMFLGNKYRWRILAEDGKHWHGTKAKFKKQY